MGNVIIKSTCLRFSDLLTNLPSGCGKYFTYICLRTIAKTNFGFEKFRRIVYILSQAIAFHDSFLKRNDITRIIPKELNIAI